MGSPLASHGRIAVGFLDIFLEEDGNGSRGVFGRTRGTGGTGAGVTASNEIFTLPAGPVSMAVGLNYLSLDRSAETLSGGESQPGQAPMGELKENSRGSISLSA